MIDHKGVSVALYPASRFLLPARLRARLFAKHKVLQLSQAAIAKSPEIATHALRDSITWIACEDVLLLKVTLPKMAGSQRRAVVGFAIEESIAQPLEQVHVVLGPQLNLAAKEHENDVTEGGSWLVAVVSNAVMADLVAAHSASTAPMIPDVMALQVPDAGDWTVLAQQDRVLVRMPDGTGFAASPAMLPTLWHAAGSPRVVLLGGQLPADFPVAVLGQLVSSIDPSLKGFDLRSGRFARRGAGVPKGARALAIVLAVAALGHLMLLALDVAGLSRIATKQEAAVRAALAATGQQVEGDVATALTAALAAQQPSTSAGFLPLLAQTFGALQPQAGQIQIKDMRFSQPDNSLALTMEAPDLADLQTAETAFGAAGLAVVAGAATSGDGAAEVQMTLRKSLP
ncbi:type II secretion system protein GspL [Cypionkella sp. TWP1-2-1b2]|uniref:type II secretion system protein GspL n=1 Tax=Cypionkella sp. TWP1-2-1b2 TaxID=2804675 RepID=UPI003CEA5109